MPSPTERLTARLADRYAIERELGAGGMATVFLARDVRHDRMVALKVLRPELSAVVGIERFLQEIRTTASLHHPHIVPLHDSGEVDGLVFYVMPYVEGESLRDRLRRERVLPVGDAIRIAGEVADALDYAHRRGVIHRDIKPENILLHDGRALVADFGIALAISRSDGEGRITETGLSLGTPHYMSPEQASGERALTARTDIYALGATLYEMLTGDPPFTGSTAQVVIAKALTESPGGIRAYRETVPEHVEAAVLTALRKLPADRFATAAEFAEALQNESRVRAAPGGPVSAPRPGRRRIALAAVAGLAMLAAGVAIGYRLRPGGPTGSAARVVIPLPAGQLLAQGAYPFDVAPDGSAIVYVADRDGQTQLVMRPIGAFETRVLEGTDGAQLPFFSPDGQWIGFFAHGELQKVSRAGGAPIPLANAAGTGWGATWGSDGTIYFSLGGPTLHAVSERGGPVSAISLRLARSGPERAGAASQDSVVDARWPQALPDGKHVLISTRSSIGVLTLGSGEVRLVLEGGQGRYLLTGHLLYHESEGRVRTVPFDLRRLAVTGGPTPAIEAFRGPGIGAAYFAVSQTGTLVYVPGGFHRTLVLVDRDGRETPVAVEPRGYRFPRFSPDGRVIAVTVDPRPSQIWVVDPTRGRAMALTTSEHNIHAVWAPNGERLAFYRTGGVSWMGYPGGVAPEWVMTPRPFTYPYDWADDGRILAERHDGALVDIVSLAFGDSAPVPLIATAANERKPSLSPDGRWLAFLSDHSGVNEVYVRPYPGPGPTQVVSVGGGVDPLWSADGRELLYRRGSRIMAVAVRTVPTFETAGEPRELFSGSYDFTQDDNWDIAPDGRFVMVKGDPDATGRFLVVLNWFEELRARR